MLLTPSLKLAFATLLLVAASSVMVPATLILGPTIENKYFPVLVNEVYTEVVATTDDTVALAVSANKVRACTYNGTSALVRKNGVWSRGDVSFSIGTNGGTRALGQQSMGVWTVHPEGNAVKFEIHYTCHGLWDTTHTLPVWTRRARIQSE